MDNLGKMLKWAADHGVITLRMWYWAPNWFADVRFNPAARAESHIVRDPSLEKALAEAINLALTDWPDELRGFDIYPRRIEVLINTPDTGDYETDATWSAAA